MKLTRSANNGTKPTRECNRGVLISCGKRVRNAIGSWARVVVEQTISHRNQFQVRSPV